MSTRILIVAAAVAALAACDKSADERARDTSKVDPSATTGASQIPTTPANLPKPATQDEKREGANPVQGQVDPKEREQRKDFQQKGDAAGPSAADTTPRK
jgi:hypothetical protein